MTRHAVHRIGEPYSLAAARHQAEVDIAARTEAHHETEVSRIHGMTVGDWLSELGPGDRGQVDEIIQLHASGWRV